MTITDEMVERAARAICRQYELDDGFSPEQADRAAASEMYRNFMLAARAVLLAALGETHVVVPREPTQAMSVDGGLAIEEAMFNSDKLVFDGAADCYRAMIAAAVPSPDRGGAPSPELPIISD